MPDLFHCYFPEADQTTADAMSYMAARPGEAAELAASEKCQRDVEWSDNVVVVFGPTMSTPETYVVEVVSVPSFTARAVKKR